MKRAIKVLSLFALSSGFVMSGACIMSGDGWSFFPTIGFGAGLPFISSLTT